MRKTIIALFLLSISALTATPLTTVVAQNIIGHDGLPATGVVTIRATNACTIGTDYLSPKTITVKFTGGAFSVSLVPNDACLPSGSYMVTWSVRGSVQNETEYWYVTTSGTALKVSDVVIPKSIPVNPLVQWNQLTGTSYPDGMYCVQISSHKVLGLIPCASASSAPISFSTLTASQWGSLTSSQWALLVN